MLCTSYHSNEQCKSLAVFGNIGKRREKHRVHGVSTEEDWSVITKSDDEPTATDGDEQ